MVAGDDLVQGIDEIIAVIVVGEIQGRGVLERAAMVTRGNLVDGAHSGVLRRVARLANRIAEIEYVSGRQAGRSRGQHRHLQPLVGDDAIVPQQRHAVGAIGAGAMAIFRTREAAEAFVKQDPFVLEGLVKSYAIREWGDQMLE